MEQISSLYDSTASDGFFNYEQQQSALSDSDIKDIVLELTSSLELEQQLQHYLGQLQRRLPIVGISVRSDDCQWQVGKVERSNQAARLNLPVEDMPDVNVEYQLTTNLSLRGRQMLNLIHHFWHQPLKNALDYQSLKRLATRDHLTGLGNRSAYDDILHRFISQAHRAGVGFSLLMLDLDKFKPVNDTYGHDQGDRVLVQIANILKANMRDTDFAFRFGGDEFCCLLQDANQAVGQKVVERIEQAIGDNPVLRKYSITASTGMAIYEKNDDEQTLLKRADAQLYAQKGKQLAAIPAALAMGA